MNKKILFFLGALCVLAGFVHLRPAFFVNVTEEVAFVLAPSAQRALEYGERHFDSKHGALYDIDRAEHFFSIAAHMDPRLPHVNHELARVAFLRGKFDKALWYIDREIEFHEDVIPNSFYIKGLIQGYRGIYGDAATNYERYLRSDPTNWAAINDYAWVLLKAKRAREAVVATAGGLAKFPDNPWLLNSNAIALYEMGLVDAAHDQALRAASAVQAVTESYWLMAYPGNDPRVAADGVLTFKDAVLRNMHTILLAKSPHEVQLDTFHE